jgi:hypothetical protein
LHQHHEAPQYEDHDPAHRRHVIGQLQEADLPSDDLVVEPDGHCAAGRSQQGDDAARPGHVGHADEHILAELARRLVVAGVERIDRHQQRVHRGSNRGVRHDMGEQRRHHEDAEQDHARLLADQAEHLVGHALG